MENILHQIKAYLYDNPLTDNPNDFIAKVSSERSLNVKQICESAASRGGADISATSIQHGVELFLKEMIYQLCNGYSVNTSCFKVNPSIKGVFNSPDERFNPEKHSLHFQFSQGDQLRKRLSDIDIEIVGVANNSPNMDQILDLKSGSVNDLLTPQRNLRISGRRLKIVGYNPEVGIYFINQETTEETKVDPTDIAINTRSELMIIIPSLEEGVYKLRVTTQYASHALLKEPRTVVFDKLLSIV